MNTFWKNLNRDLRTLKITNNRFMQMFSTVYVCGWCCILCHRFKTCQSHPTHIATSVSCNINLIDFFINLTSLGAPKHGLIDDFIKQPLKQHTVLSSGERCWIPLCCRTARVTVLPSASFVTRFERRSSKNCVRSFLSNIYAAGPVVPSFSPRATAYRLVLSHHN